MALVLYTYLFSWLLVYTCAFQYLPLELERSIFQSVFKNDISLFSRYNYYMVNGKHGILDRRCKCIFFSSHSRDSNLSLAGNFQNWDHKNRCEIARSDSATRHESSICERTNWHNLSLIKELSLSLIIQIERAVAAQLPWASNWRKSKYLSHRACTRKRMRKTWVSNCMAALA